MDRDPYAVVVPVGRPTVAPPRLPPILIPGSLVPVQLAEPWRRACAWTIDVVPFLLLAYGLAVAVQGSRVGSALWPGIFTKNYDTRAMGLPEVGLSQGAVRGRHPGGQATSLSCGRCAGVRDLATPSRSSVWPKVIALSIAAHLGSLLKYT
jgi:hypothetical protein